MTQSPRRQFSLVGHPLYHVFLFVFWFCIASVIGLGSMILWAHHDDGLTIVGFSIYLLSMVLLIEFTYFYVTDPWLRNEETSYHVRYWRRLSWMTLMEAATISCCLAFADPSFWILASILMGVVVIFIPIWKLVESFIRHRLHTPCS